MQSNKENKMKRGLLICSSFHNLRVSHLSQAVNIVDLENARGYAYLYRMNGQTITQNNVC